MHVVIMGLKVIISTLVTLQKNNIGATSQEVSDTLAENVLTKNDVIGQAKMDIGIQIQMHISNVSMFQYYNTQILSI